MWSPARRSAYLVARSTGKSGCSALDASASCSRSFAALKNP